MASSGPATIGRRLRGLRAALEPNEWIRLGAMAAVIVALYAVGLTLLLAASRHHYRVGGGAVFGLGTGIVALTLGMRHAFDADHIAAIDNTTRSLTTKGRRPMSVGFFFALGHSSVVFALAVLVNFGVRSLDAQVLGGTSGLHQVATVIGTSVSGSFLFVIAGVNLAILVSIVKVFFELRRGRYDESELERQLNQRGLMNRVFGRFAQRIDTPAKMYPVGALFGLGFDTTSEVALLVLSGTAVANDLPFYAVLSLPLLFAAGMTTFDTIDGCFMNFAYGWAFARPIRKVYFNMTITGLSVAAAVFIGGVELLGLLPTELHWTGGAWSVFERFDINTAGFAIAALFVVTWIVALVIWRVFDVEARWELSAQQASADHSGLDEVAV